MRRPSRSRVRLPVEGRGERQRTPRRPWDGSASADYAGRRGPSWVSPSPSRLTTRFSRAPLRALRNTRAAANIFVDVRDVFVSQFRPISDRLQVVVAVRQREPALRGLHDHQFRILVVRRRAPTPKKPPAPTGAVQRGPGQSVVLLSIDAIWFELRLQRRGAPLLRALFVHAGCVVIADLLLNCGVEWFSPNWSSRMSLERR